MHIVGVSTAHAIAYHLHRREFSAFAAQRFKYGLADAQFGLKYKSIRVFTDPLEATVGLTIKSTVTGRIRRVPFWVSHGIIIFIGILVGLSKARLTAAGRSQKQRHKSSTHPSAGQLEFGIPDSAMARATHSLNLALSTPALAHYDSSTSQSPFYTFLLCYTET